MKKGKARKIKRVIRLLICLLIVFIICFLIIHRRVIMALIKGEELPEPPEWHKKFLCHLDKWQG